MVKRQGKCAQCAVRWVWTGAPSVMRASCPSCGARLLRTTYLSSLPVRYATGQGRPRSLVAVRFLALLRMDPAAAMADVRQRIADHVNRCHVAAPQHFPRSGCAMCQVLAKELGYAQAVAQ